MKFDNEQAKYLARFIAKNMIAREDVKASQLPRGQGAYVRDDSKWKMRDLIDHVTGKETYGHYLLDQDSNVKIIAFDIDLNQTGTYIPFAPEDHERYADDPTFMDDEQFIEFNPREAWVDRKHPARPWLKHQMRELVERFTDGCSHVGLGTFATYSGSKGVHVYGLYKDHVPPSYEPKTRIPAVEARILAFEAADWAMQNLTSMCYEYENMYELVPSKGKSFYRIVGTRRSTGDPVPLYRSFDNFSIEVFPKQDYIEPNRLGNLMRLPFGKNLKNPKDPTFVIDQCAASSSLVPVTDFEELKVRLEGGNPWRSIANATA